MALHLKPFYALFFNQMKKSNNFFKNIFSRGTGFNKDPDPLLRNEKFFKGCLKMRSKATKLILLDSLF